LKSIENKVQDVSSIPGGIYSKMKRKRSSLASPPVSYYEEAPDKENVILFKE